MKTYETTITIAAPVGRVWQVLTEAMPENPKPFGILRFEGTLAQDGRITLRPEVDPKRAFTLQVAAFEPPHWMVWRSGLPLGLFTGTRTFALTTAAGATTFHMQERFEGVLSGLFVRFIPDLSPSFETFARALKEKAETDE